jgi:flagellar protein FlaG
MKGVGEMVLEGTNIGGQLISGSREIERPVSVSPERQAPEVQHSEKPEEKPAPSRVDFTPRELDLIQKLVDRVAARINRSLGYRVNSSNDTVVAVITDKASGEVIKTIPSEDVQKLSARFDETIGVLFDELV